MLAKAEWQGILTNIYIPIIIIGFVALWFSPAITSLVTLLSGVLFLSRARMFSGGILKDMILPIAIILLLPFLDLVLNFENPIAKDKFLLIIGFALLFLSGAIYSLLNYKKVLNAFLILTGVVIVINVISVANYFMHKEYYDELLLQSKSIPIFDSMHHIHFGIINAIILLGLGGVLLLNKASNFSRKYAFITFLLIFVCFHILSSRTGLFSFYVAVVISLIAYSSQSGKKKIVFTTMLAIPLVLGSAYFFSSSFQNKVHNSITDIESWGNDEEINYQSMAMRIEAYKVSWQLLTEHPFGVGAGDMDKKIQLKFKENKTTLYPENRKGPHNQFLEFGVKYGWVGVISLVYFFFQLFSMSRIRWFPVLGLVTLLAVAMQLESLLERQVSIYVIGVFIPIFLVLFNKNETNGNTLT